MTTRRDFNFKMRYVTRREQLFHGRIRPNLNDALRRAAFILQREIKLQLSKSASPSRPGRPPGVGTGHLRRSIQVDDSEVEAKLRIRVGSNAVYARIQELGGTIEPVTAGALAVPLGPKGRQLALAARGNIRKLNLDMIKKKGRPPVLVIPGTKKPVFVLLSSVELPPRPYFRPAIKLATPKMIKEFEHPKLVRRRT